MPQPIDTVSIALFNSLTAGVDFEVPKYDLAGPEYDLPGGADNPAMDPIPKLTNLDLTNAQLDPTNLITGTGSVDALMETFMLHLTREFKAGRIQGAEYTKAYIAAMETAASAGTQYLLQRDQAYWTGVNAQMAVINSRVAVAVTNTQLSMAYADANTAQVNYAVTKAQLGNANSTYELQYQQLTSYIRDAEVKAAKFWTDAWITMKTIDEGLVPPDEFTNTNVNEVLATLKANNDLG